MLGRLLLALLQRGEVLSCSCGCLEAKQQAHVHRRCAVCSKFAHSNALGEGSAVCRVNGQRVLAHGEHPQNKQATISCASRISQATFSDMEQSYGDQAVLGTFEHEVCFSCW